LKIIVHFESAKNFLGLGRVRECHQCQDP